MKCENAIDLVIDSMMDELDEASKDQLSEHLAGCQPCAAEADRLRSLWDDLGGISTPPIGSDAGMKFGRLVAARERRRRSNPLVQLAAAMALFLLGGSGGYWLRGADEPLAPAARFDNSYLLLVRGPDPEGVAPASVVQEYMEWGQQLATEGRFAGANKLANEPGRWISGGEVPDGRTRSDVSGYFLINAANYEDAVATAMGSPHIRYGGTFEIREVDVTN